MLQVKLWALDKNEDNKFIPISVETVTELETEELLENMIIDNHELLESGLKLIGRQTPAGGGTLDLAGIDKDGNLVVFELKKGKLLREAVAQVIDYASYLAELDTESLCKHISECSGKKGIEKIEDFESWYQEQFSKGIEEIKENLPKMVLVGLNYDDRAERMVKFLANNGLTINIITFYVFKKDNELFLARTDIVQKRVISVPKYTQESNLENLKLLAEELKVSDLLRKMADFFKAEWFEAYEFHCKTGYSYGFTETTEKGTLSNRVYANLYLEKKKPQTVHLYFQKRATEIAQKSFEKLLLKYPNKFKLDKYDAVSAYIKPIDWSELSEPLRSVLRGIKDGWRGKRKQVEENKG